MSFALDIWRERDFLRDFALSKGWCRGEPVRLEDLVADVILRAIRSAANYKPQLCGLRTWLVTIMRHHWINQWHSAARKHELPMTALDEEQTLIVDVAACNSAADPERILLAKEQAAEIANARALFVPDADLPAKRTKERPEILRAKYPWATVVARVDGGYVVAESREAAALSGHKKTYKTGGTNKGQSPTRFYGIERDCVAWVFKSKDERAAWVAVDPNARAIATRRQARLHTLAKPDGYYMLSPSDGWVLIERRYS